MRRIVVVLGPVVMATALVGCGGDEGGDGGDSGGGGGKTLEDGTTLEKSIKGIFTNSGLKDQKITDKEIRITLDKGSKSDPTSACTSAKGINPKLIEGRTMVIVYPDGEATCSG
jgi:hypothetical protein